ncbi:MAG: saccharopine dehydrogenase NADP-binding domain-containing protein [Candidatus Cloacimonetes bacterium]|nr:saccharopine dehydrogenase NADP-binding domain-containing protein [Candidatus Cloacimonadota bacterium]
MQNVTVLGAGMVGSVMALDLARDFRVRVVDRDDAALAPLAEAGLQTQRADLSDPARIGALVKDSDWVVGAVPGFMGRTTVEAVLGAGKSIVDISFFPEDPFELDALARERGRVAIVDCGVAPGLSHMLLGHHWDTMTVSRYLCLVGGLPIERRLPWQYKAPFSPIDVLEEYTRPARLRQNGKLVEKPALSDPEWVEIPGLGTMEAVNTDGLRSLLFSLPVPEMVEKTLRWPGHYDAIRLLRDGGFLDTTPLPGMPGGPTPLELSARLLLPQWKLEPGEAELTVMRVDVQGHDERGPLLHRWDLDDRTTAAGVSSMARTTGYTCTATLRALAEGLYDVPGISPPETVARNARAFERILALLAERDVTLHHTEIRG